MKTIKIFITLCIVLFGINNLNAQLNSNFSFIDSCNFNYEFGAQQSNYYQMYFFDFGDGTSDSTSTGDTQHTYPGPGTYQASLTIYDNGQSATSTQTIQVFAVNNLTISSTGSGGCSVPQTYTFTTNQSNPNYPYVYWRWSVNNLYIGYSQTATYTFNQAGTYIIQLYAEHTWHGCPQTVYDTITINPSTLLSNPTFSVISQDCQGAYVDLTANPSGGLSPYTFNWSWQGGASTLENPSNIFIPAQSDSIVNLTLSDANGCSVTNSNVINPVNCQPLNANFGSVDSCDMNYQFYAYNLNYPAYVFDYGDGTQDSLNYGYPVHTYSMPGTYQVTLTVFNNGLSASSTQTITIYPENTVTYTYNGGGGCSLPQVYTFNGMESTPNNPITDWNWSINNQIIGFNQNLTYTFNQPGTYTVQLTGYTMQGCYSSYTQTITVSGANFTANVSSTPTAACGTFCDGSIMASATGSTGPYTFTLSNGNSQTGYQAVFDSLCEGTYTVTVYDQMQCSQTLTSYVAQDSLSNIGLTAYVNDSSACSFVQSGCIGSIELSAAGGVGPYQYSIDGGQTFQNSPLFENLCPNTYFMGVQDANGCTDFTYATVHTPDTLGVYSNSYYSTCQNDTLQGSYIEVYAYGLSGNYTYTWSDGSTSSIINNPTPGTTYSVIVTDSLGCTASATFNVPVNECYTISGHVYVDVNGNCIFDGNDYPLEGFVNLSNSAGGPWLWVYDYSDANGYYEISTTPGTYFFNIHGYNTLNFTQLCPNANYSVTLDANNPSATVDFFLTPPAPVQDLSISLGHYTNVAPSTIPNHNRWSYIQICNDGTIPMSGYAEWHYSDELTYAGPPSWSTIVPDIIDQANHTLTFNFTNLQPGDCEFIRINFDVPNNLPIGTVINDEATVFPLAGDVTPSNNTAYTSVLSQGSWDPNDKTVYPNGDITEDDNDHNYHIRFQNEGNANATRVVIRDELDSDLDLFSLRNVSASHDYIMTIENDNTLVFTFNNIQLPPKDVNEAASQGWVSFSISQDGDKPVGTEIENTAAIYFDFNEAVITNTVVNTIVEKTTGISEELIENALSVSPNPSTGLFNVEITKDIEIESLNVYDMVGNRIMTMPTVSGTQIQVNLQHSASGIYILELVSPSGKAISKLVKQ